MAVSNTLGGIAPIENNTKVKIWVEIINKLLQEGAYKEYIFKAYSVKGQDTYDFSNCLGMPSKFLFEDANYTVTYGGIVLQPDDYSLTGQALKFINGPPSENDYLITIRYEGKKEEILYEVKAN